MVAWTARISAVQEVETTVFSTAGLKVVMMAIELAELLVAVLVVCLAGLVVVLKDLLMVSMWVGGLVEK